MRNKGLVKFFRIVKHGVDAIRILDFIRDDDDHGDSGEQSIITDGENQPREEPDATPAWKSSCIRCIRWLLELQDLIG